MESVQPYLGGAYDFLQTGFSTVNSQVAALVIALIAAVLMKQWKQIWAMALGAVVFQILVAVMIPVLGGGRFQLPNLISPEFLISTAATFVGFLIVISVFFFVKKNVLKAA